jgi:hypothetical protein
VRVNGEQPALEVSTSTAEAAQGELQLFCVLNGMGQKQIVNALV